MSDFTGSFWSSYITIISLVGILACLVLLWVTARNKNTGHPDNTTGHVWDEDLREMNNPLPVWWVGLFVLTVVFSLGYLWLYPGLGTYKGSLNWSSQNEYDTEVSKPMPNWLLCMRALMPCRLKSWLSMRKDTRLANICS